MRLGPHRWRWLALGAVVLVTLCARVWVVLHFPEPDSDAQGHLAIAASLLTHPFNVAAHWVWPPGYHYFLAALLGLGFDAQRIRLVDCGLAALLPLVVWLYVERTIEPDASRSARLAPFLAAVLCAAMPLVNLLGTSAQPESLFTLVVLATAWAIDVRRFALAGALLASATLIRYDAWGALALLTGLRALGASPRVMRHLPPPIARACSLPLVVIVPAIAVTAGWFLAHRITDGTWLGFVRELCHNTHLQRDAYQRDRWTEMLWFPVVEPYYLFGLTIPLFCVGIRRAWRAGFIVPLGIYAFLLARYSFKAALGSARYYESLTPFLCIGAAYGASAIGERWRWALPPAYLAALAHVARLLLLMFRWAWHP